MRTTTPKAEGNRAIERRPLLRSRGRRESATSACAGRAYLSHRALTPAERDQIRTLAEGVKVAGAHEANWDGRDDGGQRMRPGVYLYRMETGGWRSQRKLVVYAR